MGKKETITGRFNQKEHDWIRNFRTWKKIKNDNQLVRIAIENLLNVRLADGKCNPPKLPPEYLTAYNFFELLRTEFSKNPRIKSKIEKIFNKWKTEFYLKWIPEYNKKLDRSNLMLDSFDKSKPKGRPKKPKKRRGRPADKGLEG